MKVRGVARERDRYRDRERGEAKRKKRKTDRERRRASKESVRIHWRVGVTERENPLHDLVKKDVYSQSMYSRKH